MPETLPEAYSASDDLVTFINEETQRLVRCRWGRIEPLYVPAWVRHIDGMLEKLERQAEHDGFNGVVVMNEVWALKPL